ncbi:unnamed protein product [Penicillium nalgiovense]|uniref:Uncharacterized protein n=1 Tax=Penicillium nalgiovense TaxID=60175 RepID=A0A1V6Z1J6_PENNA|nr:hypothetical protein PENNAL_c0005G01188 [Penicillium nalgiovense]CAG7951526.1 unnamed protein product [Penicillium nalgiovense]CAG7953628.1 unnamed protein product [Penicillium nalgiovense]CAG7955796.1 unnamed protein product [Penicillium nalgiovense]CAG7981335.1 unnamed protein product [Penicillium nalgiovense]
MESIKVPKRPTLRWNKYRRQVLCCLYRFFVCNKKQTEEIFSYMFRSHLNDRGIHGFVPFATLNTQWAWMKSRRDPVWSHVHTGTAFDTNGEWKEIIENIKSAAKTLLFELHEKTEDDINISHSSSVGSDDERSIALNGPAPMLPHSFSTSETLSPMVLVSPRWDHGFGGSPKASQSIEQNVDQTTNRTIDRRNESQNDPRNKLHRSNEPVVTGHGKLCFWCRHEGAAYEPKGIQELQNGVYDDSGYEGHSHDHQHNDPQDDPVMREYGQGLKQFTRELHGEVPYSDEGSPDSGNETYPTTPHDGLSNMRPFCDPHLPSPSHLEQEPLDSEDNSDWCADRESPVDMTGFGTPSISMEDQNGALVDDRIPAREALSRFNFPHTRVGRGEAPDDSFGQRASRYGWPSSDEIMVETLRQLSVEAPRQVENQSNKSSHQEMDVLMYDGNTWNQV